MGEENPGRTPSDTLIKLDARLAELRRQLAKDSPDPPPETETRALARLVFDFLEGDPGKLGEFVHALGHLAAMKRVQ